MEYRELTQQEQLRALEIRVERTRAEKEAFRLLPNSMKERVEIDAPVAFEGHAAFYPDLLFRDLKLIIEIDGSIHRRYEQQRIDEHRNGVFLEHGFHIIRILNEDVCVNIAFWQRLVEGLAKMNSLGKRNEVKNYITELNELIDQEVHRAISWDDEPDWVFFPNISNSNKWNPIGCVQMCHELLFC